MVITSADADQDRRSKCAIVTQIIASTIKNISSSAEHLEAFFVAFLKTKLKKFIILLYTSLKLWLLKSAAIF